MLTHVLAVAGLGLLCALWVFVQRMGDDSGAGDAGDARTKCGGCDLERDCAEPVEGRGPADPNRV